MPQITLTFPSTVELNVSCQVGDTAYFSPTTSIAGFATSAQSTVVEIGRVISISKASGVWVLICDTNLINGQQPTTSDFISFSKNNSVNLSSILGYYANITMINHSKEKIELFAVGSEISQSSK